MNVLLISGLGPEYPNHSLLAGSTFEALAAEGSPSLPVWQDAERFDLETLREVRCKNDRAIQRTWRRDYELPLLPDRSVTENSVIEKLVDRLGMASADLPNPTTAATQRADVLSQLTGHGVASHSV